MKAALLFLLMCAPVFAQSSDALQYAPRQLLLVSPEAGTEAILPMLVTADGKQHLEFVPVSQVKEYLEKGGQPIRLGDVLSALGEATQTINRLQAENDKLWKVAMKDNPQPPAVVVQQPEPSQQSMSLQKYMLLRSLVPQTQPYRLPMPVNPNAGRLKTNCTSTQLGNTTNTNCN